MEEGVSLEIMEDLSSFIATRNLPQADLDGMSGMLRIHCGGGR